jgi:hypothetical protein
MIITFLKDVIFYNIGYFTVKIFSYGKYPHKHDSIIGDNFLEILGALIAVLIVSFLGVVLS